MDLGCEWLHSADRNALAPLAEQFGFSINRRRPDWTTRLRYSGESPEAEADWIGRARGALLGDPPRRAGAGRRAGLLGAGAGWAVERAVRCDQHLGQRRRARISVGQGQRPLRRQRHQLAACARATERCSRRSPRGCRSPMARRSRESRMAAGASAWRRAAARSSADAGHRHRADRRDRRRASRL